MIARAVAGKALVVTGAALLSLMALAAVAGPMLLPYDHVSQDYSAILRPPDTVHWLGTARLGEDLAAQTLAGLRKSLVIGVVAAVVSTGIAVAIGMAAGYLRGAVDRLAMAVVDILLVLPPILVVAVLSAVFLDHSWLLLVVAIAAFQWMLGARMVRARVSTLRVTGYVRAAETMGASRLHVMRTHLIPNLVPFIVIDCTLSVATAVLAESGLSYFGFGVQPPDVSLGTLIAAGSPSAATYPWLFLVPATVLVLTVLGIGLLGEGIRQARAESAS